MKNDHSAPLCDAGQQINLWNKNQPIIDFKVKKKNKNSFKL